MATIKGKWKWNEVVNCDYQAHNEYHLNFKSNKIKFDTLRLEWAVGKHELHYWNLNDKVYILAGISANMNEDFYSVKEEYRIMDFGETEQEISEELYAFIRANATEYSPIAEKLVEVASNVPKVFEAGKQQGHGEGYKEGYNKGYNEGLDTDAYEEGKKAERSDFWDAFQGATRRRWASAFQNASWNDITFYPKYDLIISGDASSLFRYCGITDLESRLNECSVILDTSECTSLNSGFGESKTLTTIPPIDVTKCTASGATNGMFSGCTSLKTIRKFIVSEEGQFPNTFQNCPLLENIVFEGVIGQNISFESSTKLTRASIESILNALSDTATGKTITLSNDAVYEAFALRDDNGNKLPYLEGIWQEYIYIKSNWTITLV